MLGVGLGEDGADGGGDNAVEKAPSSLSPTAKPSTSRCPSAASPVAITTAWDTTAG
jgi:hypothetical protein